MSAFDRCHTCNVHPAGIVISRRICTVADRIPVAMPMIVRPLLESKMGIVMMMMSFRVGLFADSSIIRHQCIASSIVTHYYIFN